MGRKKLYDENAVLEAAMICFWRHGFKGVSTRDLAKAMGINQNSVYASFQSKENLFIRTLEYYYENIIKQFISGLKEDSTLEDLRHFFEKTVNTPESNVPTGCFVWKSMVEVGGRNEQVDKVVQEYQALITQKFATILTNSYSSANKDFIHSKSEFLFGAYLGLVMQKIMLLNGDPIQNYVDGVMDAVTL